MLQGATCTDRSAPARYIAQKFREKTRFSDSGFAGNQNESSVAMRFPAYARKGFQFVGSSDERPLKIAVNRHGAMFVFCLLASARVSFGDAVRLDGNAVEDLS